jgi:hypothetical protein
MPQTPLSLRLGRGVELTQGATADGSKERNRPLPRPAALLDC